jgi:hypothetical protein
MTEITVAASENSAIRRAQTASRETGSSTSRCRAIAAYFRPAFATIPHDQLTALVPLL